MLRKPWCSRLATTREPRNPVDPVTSTRSPKPTIISPGVKPASPSLTLVTTAPSEERKDIEAIVLELEKLLCDLLDAMPCLGPAFGSRAAKDRRTVDLGASVSEHGVVHERCAPTAETRRHDDNGPDMRAGQSVTNLAGGIETDRLGLANQNDFPRREPRLSGHDVGNTLGDRI